MRARSGMGQAGALQQKWIIILLACSAAMSPLLLVLYMSSLLSAIAPYHCGRALPLSDKPQHSLATRGKLVCCQYPQRPKFWEPYNLKLYYNYNAGRGEEVQRFSFYRDQEVGCQDGLLSPLLRDASLVDTISQCDQNPLCTFFEWSPNKIGYLCNGRPADESGAPRFFRSHAGWVNGDKEGCETYDVVRAQMDRHVGILPHCISGLVRACVFWHTPSGACLDDHIKLTPTGEFITRNGHVCLNEGMLLLKDELTERALGAAPRITCKWSLHVR